MCADCSHLPVRVSDSFIAEGGRFAAGVLFALDSGADVVQEALGAISNPPQAQPAVDAAHRRGVPVVASMADEQSQHANLPGGDEPHDPGQLGHRRRRLPGRRRHGRHRPTRHAGGQRVHQHRRHRVGLGALRRLLVGGDRQRVGMVGLIEAAARIGPDCRRIPTWPRSGWSARARNVLSADEVAQLLRATADDIDFSTPNASIRANELTDDFGQRRFESVKGWDATHGYGRVNAYEAVRRRGDGRHPARGRPDLAGVVLGAPDHGPLRSAGVSPRSARRRYSTGSSGPPASRRRCTPAPTCGAPCRRTRGLTAPLDGTLGRWTWPRSQRRCPAAAPARRAATGPARTRTASRCGSGWSSPTPRAGWRTMHRHLAVHDDPDLIAVDSPAGWAPRARSSSTSTGTAPTSWSSATDDGKVHARRLRRLRAARVPGAHADRGRTGTRRRATALADGIEPPGAAVPVGAPAVADMDGDGTFEIVVTDFDGGVHVWSADGRRWPRCAPTSASAARRAPTAATAEAGISGRRRSATWTATATWRSSSPRWTATSMHGTTTAPPSTGSRSSLVDPAKIAAVDPESHQVTFATRRPPGRVASSSPPPRWWT